MSPTARTDPKLDSLINEITIDCHDEDEQLMGFEGRLRRRSRPPVPRHRPRRGHPGAIRQYRQRSPRADRHLHTRGTSLRDRAARHRHPRRPSHLTPDQRIPPLERYLNSYHSCRATPGPAPVPITDPRDCESPHRLPAGRLDARRQQGATFARVLQEDARTCGAPAVKNRGPEPDCADFQGKRPGTPSLPCKCSTG
jgi:hypothetical protein